MEIKYTINTKKKEIEKSSQAIYSTILVFLMVIIAQFSMLMPLPVLPVIAKNFLVAPSATAIIVSVFLFGLGFGQLIFGPLSDAYGRRIIILAGTLISLLGGLLCSTSTTLSSLILGRFLMGFGDSALSTLSRCILRDIHKDQNLLKALSFLSMLVSLTPMLAVLLGGWLGSVSNWRYVFYIQFAFVFLFLILFYLTFEETKNSEKFRFSVRSVISTYKKIFLDSYFFSRASMLLVVYFLIILTSTLGPLFLENKLGISIRHYGELAVIPAAGIFVGSTLFCNFSGKKWVRYLIPFFVLMSAIFLINTTLSAKQFIFSYFLFSISVGITYPLILGELLRFYDSSISGFVTSLSGSSQFVGSAVFGNLLIRYWVDNASKLGYIYFISAVFFLIVLLQLRKLSRV